MTIFMRIKSGKFMMKNYLVMVAIALVAANVYATPVDVTKSSITATFTQTGVPVEAKFTRFKADVKFDPAAPQQTQANMQVDVSSFDLGDPEYNKEVQKPEWFNAPKFAQATFVTQSVRALAPDRLEATGTLTIKGVAQNVVVPIAVKQVGNQRAFSGELPIKRLAFKIGEGDWSATDMLADVVKIKFMVVVVSQ